MLDLMLRKFDRSSSCNKKNSLNCYGSINLRKPNHVLQIDMSQHNDDKIKAIKVVLTETSPKLIKLVSKVCEMEET